MTKEVTITKAMVGEVGFNAETMLPEVTNVETLTLLGELTKAKAEKVLRKAGETKTLFKVETETLVYKMAVSEFIKVATLVTDEDNVDEEEEEEEEEKEEEKPAPKKGKVTVIPKETV